MRDGVHCKEQGLKRNQKVLEGINLVQISPAGGSAILHLGTDYAVVNPGPPRTASTASGFSSILAQHSRQLLCPQGSERTGKLGLHLRPLRASPGISLGLSIS